MIGFYERHHKKIIYPLVTIATILCVYFVIIYNASNMSSFFTSILYALFLFIVTNHSTTQSLKIKNLFYKRKQQYLNLIKLKENISSLRNFQNNNMISFIIFFKGLTGRFEEQKNISATIQQDGIYLKNSYLKLENDYLNQRDDLDKIFTEVINQSITNKIYPIFNIDSFLQDTDKWCNENLKDDYTKLVKNKLSIAKIEYKSTIKNLARLKRKLIKEYNDIFKKSQRDISYFELTYGNKLIKSIEDSNELQIAFNSIHQQFDDLKSLMITREDIENHFENHFEKYFDNSSMILQYLKDIENTITDLYEMIEDQ